MLYQYLRTQIFSSVKLCYPSFELRDSTITFAYNPLNNAGLSSPYIFTLAKFFHSSPDAVAALVMSRFSWDENFVIPDTELIHTISGGYLNFFPSSQYLTKTLNALSGIDYTIADDLVAIFPQLIQNIIKKGIAFLEHTPEPQNIDAFDISGLLLEKIEHTLVVLLAISEPRELHSSDAIFFFLRTICSNLENYLKKKPIITSEKHTTDKRLRLFRATLNRIVSLCRCYGEIVSLTPEK